MAKPITAPRLTTAPKASRTGAPRSRREDRLQRGIDSGWDNATPFDPERAVVTADLAAFLVLPLRELAALAAELGLADDARDWTRGAEEIQEAMLDELWTGERSVARGAESGNTWGSSSLLDLMPIDLREERVEALMADEAAASDQDADTPEGASGPTPGRKPTPRTA